MLVLSIPRSSAPYVQRAQRGWRARSERAAQLAAALCDLLLTGPLPLPELEDQLWQQAAGAEGAAVLLLVLRSLARDGLIEVELVAGQTPLARVQRALPGPSGSALPPVLKLSRLASLRPDQGWLILESPLHPGRVVLLAEQGAMVCARLAQGTTRQELRELAGVASEPEALEELLSSIAAIGALEPSAAELQDALLQWEPHDAMFHTRTRGGRSAAAQGGTFRFVGQRQPEAAVPRRTFGPAIALPEIELGAEATALQALMQRRRSIRRYGSQPLTAAELGALLRMVARDRAFHPADPDKATSYQTLSRPYPSAGGMHELHLYPIVHRCEGLARGVYCYDGAADRLLVVAPMNAAGERLLREAALSMAQQNAPDVLLCIAARFGRLNWKYEGIAYSLLLKNVGVLQQALYLAATALRLAPCALGRGDAEQFLRATGNRPFEEESVGEFALGSLPAKGAASK